MLLVRRSQKVWCSLTRSGFSTTDALPPALALLCSIRKQQRHPSRKKIGAPCLVLRLEAPKRFFRLAVLLLHPDPTLRQTNPGLAVRRAVCTYLRFCVPAPRGFPLPPRCPVRRRGCGRACAPSIAGARSRSRYG